MPSSEQNDSEVVDHNTDDTVVLLFTKCPPHHIKYDSYTDTCFTPVALLFMDCIVIV